MTHAELWQHWYNEVWNGRKADAIDALLAPDVVLHPTPGAAPVDREGFKAFHAQVLTKYARVEGTIYDPIEAGEWVSVRAKLTFVEEGKRDELHVHGLQRARVRDGVFVEVWDSWDWPDVLETTGQIPAKTVESFLTQV